MAGEFERLMPGKEPGGNEGSSPISLSTPPEYGCGMAISRSAVRWTAFYIFILVLAPITVSVVGEFFIKVAEEQGYYAEPSRKLGAVMTALGNFVSHPIFLFAVAALGGLTIGLWLDHFLRRRVDAPPTARICDFGQMRWDMKELDPGENFGGRQGYFRLFIPIIFASDTPSTMARVSVLRPLDRGALKLGIVPARPIYNWRPFEQRNLMAGDSEDILIATIAVNKQHNGWYGEIRPEAAYIGNGTKHLFEIEISSGATKQTHRVYLERSHDQVYASGSFPGEVCRTVYSHPRRNGRFQVEVDR